MSNKENPLVPLEAALRDLVAWWQDQEISGVVIGGVAVSILGRPRLTLDVDAVFRPVNEIRSAARKVGAELDLGEHWLNDAVKGFLSESGRFDQYLDLAQLKVFCAQPDYLLAMKCLSMRLGREFHDEADVRYLLRHLNIESYDDALSMITRYYPLERFPQQTLYALEEILAP